MRRLPWLLTRQRERAVPEAPCKLPQSCGERGCLVASWPMCFGVLCLGLLSACGSRPEQNESPAGGPSSTIADTAPAEIEAAQELVEILLRRLALVQQVARAKWNSQAAIYDPQRESDLLRATSEQATVCGADAEAWQKFLSAQLAASRQLQEELHALWRASNHPPWPDAPDLSSELRPQLDTLNAELLSVWVELTRSGERTQCKRAGDMLRAELQEAGYSAEVASISVAPLQDSAPVQGVGP